VRGGGVRTNEVCSVVIKASAMKEALKMFVIVTEVWQCNVLII
jgi:hypothetical protein